MATKSKLCLGLALFFLAAGSLIWWGPLHGKLPPSFDIAIPLGAVFLGLFLVSQMFNKEDKIYGEDQKRAAEVTGQTVKIPPADRL